MNAALRQRIRDVFWNKNNFEGRLDEAINMVIEEAAVVACNCGNGASEIHGRGCKYYDVLNLKVKEGE